MDISTYTPIRPKRTVKPGSEFSGGKKILDAAKRNKSEPLSRRFAEFNFVLFGQNSMNFEIISKMNVEELKYFLRMRGLKVSGRKEDLVARVFTAKENNVQPSKTAQEVEMKIQQEYCDKLVVNDVFIPDPYSLEGWLSEEDGIRLWPSILYPDIFNHLTFNPAGLASKYLSDYKNSKAFSYFINRWLGLISYHSIDESSPYCFLKTDCQPSERLNDPPHKLWICIKKRGAKIHCAHCSCMAGMSQT